MVYLPTLSQTIFLEEPKYHIKRTRGILRQRGRAGGPPPSGPRGNPPKLRACGCSPPPTLRLERGASVGGELRTLALKNLGDVRADAQWIVTARLLYHLQRMPCPRLRVRFEMP